MLFSRKYRIRIPEPCHEDWSKMTPTEKGRFCDSCAKTVTDFSIMTEFQINEAFRNASGKMCGRFRKDQLEKVYTLKPKLQLSAQRRFFQYLLSAFVGLFGVQRVFGQDSLRTVQADSSQTLSDNDTTLADTVALAQTDTSLIWSDSMAKAICVSEVVTVSEPETITVDFIGVVMGMTYTPPYGYTYPWLPPENEVPEILNPEKHPLRIRGEKEKVPVEVKANPNRKPPVPPVNHERIVSDAVLPEEWRIKKES